MTAYDELMTSALEGPGCPNDSCEMPLSLTIDPLALINEMDELRMQAVMQLGKSHGILIDVLDLTTEQSTFASGYFFWKHGIDTQGLFFGPRFDRIFLKSVPLIKVLMEKRKTQNFGPIAKEMLSELLRFGYSIERIDILVKAIESKFLHHYPEFKGVDRKSSLIFAMIYMINLAHMIKERIDLTRKRPTAVAKRVCLSS